jgi:hypothetical protein
MLGMRLHWQRGHDGRLWRLGLEVECHHVGLVAGIPASTKLK